MPSRPCIRCGTTVTRARTRGGTLSWKDYSEDPEGDFVLRGVIATDLKTQPVELARHSRRWSVHVCKQIERRDHR